MTTIESKTKKSKYSSHRGVPTSLACEMPHDMVYTSSSSYQSIPPPPPAPPLESSMKMFELPPPPPPPPRMPPYGSTRAPTPPRIQEASFCDVLTPKTPRTPGHFGRGAATSSSTTTTSPPESSKKRHLVEEAQDQRKRQRQQQQEEEEEQERQREKERRRQQREMDRKREERKKAAAATLAPPPVPPPVAPIVEKSPKVVAPTVRALPFEFFAAPTPDATTAPTTPVIPRPPKSSKASDSSRRAFRTGKPVPASDRSRMAFRSGKAEPMTSAPESTTSKIVIPEQQDVIVRGMHMIEEPSKPEVVAPESDEPKPWDAADEDSANVVYTPVAPEDSVLAYFEANESRETSAFSFYEPPPAPESAPESINSHLRVSDDAPELPANGDAGGPIKKPRRSEPGDKEKNKEKDEKDLATRMAMFRSRMSSKKKSQEKFDPLLVDRVNQKKKVKTPEPEKSPEPQEPEPKDYDEEYIDVVGGADELEGEPHVYEPIVFDSMDPVEPMEQEDSQHPMSQDPTFEEPQYAYEPMVLETAEPAVEQEPQEPEPVYTESELLGPQTEAKPIQEAPEPMELEPEIQEPEAKEPEPTREKTPEKEKTPEATAITPPPSEEKPSLLDSPKSIETDSKPTDTTAPDTPAETPSETPAEEETDAEKARRERSPSLEIISVGTYTEPYKPKLRRKKRNWIPSPVDPDAPPILASVLTFEEEKKPELLPENNPVDDQPGTSNSVAFRRMRGSTPRQPIVTKAALKMGVAPSQQGPLPQQGPQPHPLAVKRHAPTNSPSPTPSNRSSRSSCNAARETAIIETFRYTRSAEAVERLRKLDVEEEFRIGNMIKALKTTQAGLSGHVEKLMNLEHVLYEDSIRTEMGNEDTVRRMAEVKAEQESRERSLREGSVASAISTISAFSTPTLPPVRHKLPMGPSPSRESMSSRASHLDTPNDSDSDNEGKSTKMKIDKALTRIRQGRSVQEAVEDSSLAGLIYPDHLKRKNPAPHTNSMARSIDMNPSVDQRHEILKSLMKRQQSNGLAKNSMCQGVVKHMAEEDSDRKTRRGHRRVHPDFEKSKRDAELRAGTISSGTSNRNLKMLSKEHNLPKMQCKFRKYVRVIKHPNGGATYIKCDFNQISKEFSKKDIEKFCRQFSRLGFAENRGFAIFCIAIVENGAGVMPDMFTKLCEESNGTLQVKVGSLTNKQLIETMPIQKYQKDVLETYENGTFRVGPLMAVSTVGAKQEEAGGHFKGFLKELDTHPFTGPMMPWGEFSHLHQMPPTQSDDGPILWVRPGEQMVPMTETRRRDDPKHPLSTRHAERREVEFLDRTPCHADQVNDKETLKRSTAAVGVLQGIKTLEQQLEDYHPWTAEERRVVKEVVVFEASDLHAVVNNLGMDLFEPPVNQCGAWVEEAKLNSMRRQGVRYAKLELKENDMYFLPRNVVHQFRTVSACVSVAWHVRLKHYYYPKETPSIDDHTEFMCESDYSDAGDFNGG